MTRSDIIELANQLTERKGERVLNLPLLFSHVLQDFCGRSRYWWRNYYATFSTVAGQQDYDLTDSSVFTPDLTEIAVEEITEVALMISGGVTYLDPVFDPRTIIEMRPDGRRKVRINAVHECYATIQGWNSKVGFRPNGNK